jgi:hypothetical protein
MSGSNSGAKTLTIDDAVAAIHLDARRKDQHVAQALMIAFEVSSTGSFGIRPAGTSEFPDRTGSLSMVAHGEIAAEAVE